jgi:plasmid stabilization system protein ParE
MPRCGRTVPEFDDPRFREVIYGNHRIVYRIIGADDRIEILAVIHGGRDIRGAFLYIAPSASAGIFVTKSLSTRIRS